MFDNNNTIGRGGGDGGGDDHDYQPLDDRALDVQILPQHLRMTYGDNVSPPTTSAPFNRPREYRELREITAGQQIVGVLFGAFLTVGVCWLAYQGRYVTQHGLQSRIFCSNFDSNLCYLSCFDLVPNLTIPLFLLIF